MGIGGSIFLIAIGAVLIFALESDISGLDIDALGVILMLAGGLGLFMTLVIWGPSRLRAGAIVEEHRVYEEPRPHNGGVIEEHRVYEEPPVYDEQPPR